MSNNLAVQPHGEFPSLASRLLQLLYVLCDDALDYLWSLITKKSKLERLLERSENIPPARILEIERFLIRKLNVHSNRLFRGSTDCETILSDGSVSAKGEQREELKKRLENVVLTIDTYESLNSQIESFRREKYDSNNAVHEEKLLELWDLLVPNVNIEGRLGKHWRHVGFQGDDPATDFRGMGILSLDQLIYLAKHYPAEARQMMIASHHPKIGFPLAVAGITMTAVTRQLLNSGKLKNLFYQSKENMNLNLFNETYCKIFITFVNYWKASNPPSIMEFNPVRANFERKLIGELQKDNCNIQGISP